MYKEYFSLKESPFNITPDPRFFFPSKSHEDALHHLMYGINEKKGFILISGEVGTGKTVICRLLINMLDPNNTKTALLLFPAYSDIELLESINQDFGIKQNGITKKELIDNLNSFLLDLSTRGKNAVLIIDEAQNLDIKILEQIRLLSNLETYKEKLIQIILVGQPELDKKLNRPDLRQLNQRIAIRYKTGILDRKETEEYIYHRLKVAGASGGINFSKEALGRIYEGSKGIPRKINLICERAMLSAYAEDKRVIDYKNANRAVLETYDGITLAEEKSAEQQIQHSGKTEMKKIGTFKSQNTIHYKNAIILKSFRKKRGLPLPKGFL